MTEPTDDLTQTAAWRRGTANAKATIAAAELERARLNALPAPVVEKPAPSLRVVAVDVTLDPTRHWTDWAQAVRDAMSRP